MFARQPLTYSLAFSLSLQSKSTLNSEFRIKALCYFARGPLARLRPVLQSHRPSFSS